MPNRQAPILIVDDDAARASAHAGALAAVGYAVHQEHDSLNGLLAVEELRPALVVLHWALPYLDGAAFLAVLQAGLCRPPPVLVLADRCVDTHVVHRAGGRACLPLDVPPTVLVRAIARLLFDETRSAPS